MPRGKSLSPDAIAELALRRYCGEPRVSIAKVMGIAYHIASQDRGKRQQYAKGWYARNRERQLAKSRLRHLETFQYDSTKRRRAKLARYGLTPEAYEALLLTQNGGCAICGRTDSGTALHEKLGVDHDHQNGATRGLLCQPCNAGLGGFKDRPEFLRTAIEYLAKWGIT